jgi:hypothetical protein
VLVANPSVDYQPRQQKQKTAQWAMILHSHWWIVCLSFVDCARVYDVLVLVLDRRTLRNPCAMSRTVHLCVRRYGHTFTFAFQTVKQYILQNKDKNNERENLKWVCGKNLKWNKYSRAQPISYSWLILCGLPADIGVCYLLILKWLWSCACGVEGVR